jgi:hypothetical protein
MNGNDDEYRSGIVEVRMTANSLGARCRISVSGYMGCVIELRCMRCTLRRVSSKRELNLA